MDRRLTVTESEHRAIMQMEEDGAKLVEVVYDIIPDPLPIDEPDEVTSRDLALCQ